MEKSFEPSIISFCCRWCSYAAADLAGSMRIQYPANVKIIMVPCTGRIDIHHILNAIEAGADGVFLSGCLIGDCHYISGNHVAFERFERYFKVLEGAGISPDRFLWREISAAEGLIFAKVMKELSQKLEDMGIDKIKEENEKARKRIEGPLKRKGLIPVIEPATEEE